MSKTINNQKELQIGLKTEYRYESPAQKHLSHRFMHRLFNYYQGLFVLDSNLNVLDDNNQFLIDREKPAFDRIREIIQFSVVIGDKDFFDNSNLNENLEHLGKCYTYMVEPSLHSGKGLINSHENYPGVRIFKDYEEMISYIEAQNYQNQLIYVTGFKALKALKYLINKIELMVLENEYNTESDKIFPLTELIEMMGFSMLSESTKKTFNVTQMSKEYETYIEHEKEPELFSDYIKIAKSGISRRKKKKLKQEQVNYSYDIFRLHRKCHSNIFGLRKSFAKQLGLESQRNNLRMIQIGDYFSIYDVENMKDLTRYIYKISEFDESMDKLGLRWGDKPHTIAITETQISEVESRYNLNKNEFRSLCIKSSLQIQNR